MTVHTLRFGKPNQYYWGYCQRGINGSGGSFSSAFCAFAFRPLLVSRVSFAGMQRELPAIAKGSQTNAKSFCKYCEIPWLPDLCVLLNHDRRSPLSLSQPTRRTYKEHSRNRPGHNQNQFSKNGINSVQTRCIVKGEAQKSPLFWRFSGVFDFLRIACSLGILQENL